MDTRISINTSNSKKAINSRKPVTAGPLATAFSKGTAETSTTPLVKPGTSEIAERTSKGNHQELKGCQQQQECLPLSGCKQQQGHKQQQ
jgi:hypothetical protein